jgi:hypothetical protein
MLVASVIEDKIETRDKNNKFESRGSYGSDYED